MQKFNDVRVLREIIGDKKDSDSLNILDRKVPKLDLSRGSAVLNNFMSSKTPRNNLFARGIMFDRHSKNAEAYKEQDYMSELGSMTAPASEPRVREPPKVESYGGGPSAIAGLQTYDTPKNTGVSRAEPVQTQFQSVSPQRTSAWSVAKNIGKYTANEFTAGARSAGDSLTVREKRLRAQAGEPKAKSSAEAKTIYLQGAKQYFGGPFNNKNVSQISGNLGYAISSGNLLKLGDRGAVDRYNIANALFTSYLISLEKKHNVTGFNTLLPRLGPTEVKKLTGYKQRRDVAYAEMSGSSFMSGQGSKSVLSRSIVQPNIMQATRIGNMNPEYGSYGPETLSRMGVNQGLQANNVNNKWLALTGGNSMSHGSDKIAGILGKGPDTGTRSKLQQYLK